MESSGRPQISHLTKTETIVAHCTSPSLLPRQDKGGLMRIKKYTFCVHIVCQDCQCNVTEDKNTMAFFTGFPFEKGKHKDKITPAVKKHQL